MKPITPIQQKIYEFLVEMAKENMTPSVREIGAAVGLKSTSTVHAHLQTLEKAGYILFGVAGIVIVLLLLCYLFR